MTLFTVIYKLFQHSCLSYISNFIYFFLSFIMFLSCRPEDYCVYGCLRFGSYTLEIVAGGAYAYECLVIVYPPSAVFADLALVLLVCGCELCTKTPSCYSGSGNCSQYSPACLLVSVAVYFVFDDLQLLWSQPFGVV